MGEMAMVWTEGGNSPLKTQTGTAELVSFMSPRESSVWICENESDRRHYKRWSLTFVVTVTVSGISQR